MIIVRINGGLGNQMFQYAAAKALAVRCGSKVGLDLRVFDGPSQFGNALNHFDITGMALPEKDLPPLRKKNKLRYLMWRSGLVGPKFVEEEGDGFDPKFSGFTKNTYLKGYWQSEKYFEGISDVIRQEFSITTKPSIENVQLMKEVQSCNSVSLHIRRGDYVSDPLANATHGLCSMEYYTESLERLAEKTGTRPQIYVFSDDAEWAKENAVFKYPTRVVSLNDGAHQYEDMRLMSLCKNNIIANSSFSWWGAWLNENSEKIVIAPKQWFQAAQKHNRDICPASWIRI
ncbi:alpha-1,2-fucosyltransferase [Parasedimentitalea huanghaiensis]|uniref:Alpha-1,2-fucosyltransferase n=1 Tax=Parasedimentitalea huanghaiensis TaxID=2682100 RepID=A0A6L6WBP1_9RHOB|nr:alpha-1,2-fucosyltransferase [Zongyanglinia huanghaiensis]MVO14631.1 alpha-1,2-fucosyltransferase [Zongyanglinia huanghaiensis]